MNNDKEHQFELLVRQHKRTIYTVCYMFSHDKAEIDDLFQEILIRLWNGFDTYEGRSDARTWIYRVALNTAINQGKKERRRIVTVPLTVVENGCFYIMRGWSSKEGLDAFCKHLIKR